MKHPTMLYKYPGDHDIHGDKFDYIVVDKDNTREYNKAIKNGWSKTTAEAKTQKDKPKQQVKKSVDHEKPVMEKRTIKVVGDGLL